MDALNNILSWSFVALCAGAGLWVAASWAFGLPLPH